jgi:hypothetical protein
MTKCHTRHKTENENVRIYHIIKLENCVFTGWIVKIYHTAKTAKKRAALLLAGPPGGGGGLPTRAKNGKKKGGRWGFNPHPRAAGDPGEC